MNVIINLSGITDIDQKGHLTMPSAPSAITVDLISIEVAGSKVVLVFRDSGGNWHRKTYNGETFTQALPLLGSNKNHTRLNGLQRLDILSQGGQMYLYLDCGAIAQMGSLESGPALQLLRLMLPSSPRPQAIINALHGHGSCNISNIFLANR